MPSINATIPEFPSYHQYPWTLLTPSIFFPVKKNHNEQITLYSLTFLYNNLQGLAFEEEKKK